MLQLIMPILFEGHYTRTTEKTFRRLGRIVNFFYFFHQYNNYKKFRMP